MTFKEGALIVYKEYDNTKTRISKFIQNQDSLNKFIYSNVDWSKVPDLKDKTIRVLITIHSGATSKADTIFVARASDNEFLTQEALRVAKLIPEWDVYYRLGEVHKQINTLPIDFNEKTEQNTPPTALNSLPNQLKQQPFPKFFILPTLLNIKQSKAFLAF